MQMFLKIHPEDNVAVALHPLKAGSVFDVAGENVLLAEDIPQGHKFALRRIGSGEPVVKYGAPIGRAKMEILPGFWVHTHNLKTGLGDVLEYTWRPKTAAAGTPSGQPETAAAGMPCGQPETASAGTPSGQSKTASVGMPSRQTEAASAGVSSRQEKYYFQGYRRADQRVGVRNEIWIIPTVGCVNGIASQIERRAQIYKKGSIDAVAAFSHPYGCSQLGEDQENTRKILADLVRHPNAGGVLVLGLGCENSGVEVLKKYIGDYDPERVKFLVCQESEDELEDAMALMAKLAEHAGACRREPVPCGELTVGLKCGGSDGLSGITANPAVGIFSDLLTGSGGTTILTEVPEMFGAETLLMNRCESREVFEQTAAMVNQFKMYFKSHGQPVYENPSPGNKKGGISTLEDKSLGCTQKSGSAPVRGVLSYGETISCRGLNLLSAPGNDLVASTALAAAGAQIILFTTGRGTPFAAPVPTVKISSNTELYRHKANWIDFDCGPAANGKSLPELGRELFDYVLKVASGEPVKSEIAGIRGMAIFKQGVTL